MKVIILSLFLLCCVLAARPATPYCRSAPIPQLIPIDVNSTVRFDLEEVFDGFNLEYSAPVQDNIDIVPKYIGIKSNWPSSFNFTTAKIKAHNRFLGLIINGFESKLVIGTNDERTGIKVDKVVTVEDIPNLHCYDVDEILTRNASFAVIDCATFRQGELDQNHFLYVNLETGQRVLGGKTTDSFVNYHYLSKRNIQILEDPINRILYILRIVPRDGVDTEHQNNTFIEIFMIRNQLDPQILDVIDYTFIGEKSLSIADYQISFGQLYILAYGKGLFEIVLSPNQRIYTRNFFEIKMDMYRFKVDRIGFNDDIYLVMTNGNQIYTYQWDNINPPKLIQKYGLMAGTYVQQLVCDTQFIIITTRAEVDRQIQRKHWIFSKQSSSYTHAFNVFDAPQYGPAIMQWQGNDNTLHLYHEYNAYSFKISLPYLEINPANKVGKKQEYTVTAISRGGNNQTVNCTEKFTFLYQYYNDTSITKTGFRDNMKLTVDSPDEEQINLMREFYGRNLSYEVKFQVNGSMLVPRSYVDKIHEAVISDIPDLKHQNIVFFEMFEEQNPSKSQKPQDIYGLIQVVQEETKNQTQPTYTAHYINCKINVLDRDNTHALRCRVVSSTRFGMGRIVMSSQMFDIHERRLALVFEQSLNEVYIYYFWSVGFAYYGRKTYAGDAWTRLSGVTINKGKLFCTLEISKKIEIYNLNDLRDQGAGPVRAYPIFNLTSNIMRFFGVDYWAPVDTKISPYHDEVLFVKTKIGVMAININEQGMPQLLFHLATDNVKYDFEVNQQNLVIIDEDRCEFYHLYTPLRRTMQPYLRETIPFKFSLNEYTELTSDKLFYLVGFDEVIIINPLWSNSNQVYQQLYFKDLVLSVDAVNIDGRQILFVHTISKLFAYVIRQQPVLYIEWPPHQYSFNMTLTAYNNYTKSEPYNFTFNVLENNQTEIIPTQKFNEEEVRKLGHVNVRENDGKKFTFNVTFNDTDWFEGNVFRYTIDCKQCNASQGKIKVKNHVQEVQQLVVGRAIYDMDSTFNGIFAQQYNSYIKTWAHNDSIQYIQNIPTIYPGEVCSKIVADHNQEYVVSLCETGNEVNAYITSLISDKAFTLGPFPTEAKAVNHAKIVDDILMIVDNEDNPFARNGGIYLYALTFGEQVDMAMIDFIDNDDLRDVEGFSGMGFIGSADFHDSHGIQQYRIFITDSFSGNVFVFSFELSSDRQQIIYLSKKMINLKKYIPDHIDAPTRLKLLTVNIHYYISYDQDNTVQYYLLFTVGNWHHMEFLIVMDRTDNVKLAKLMRMFERIPWTLSNYFKLRRSWHKSQFAVPYIDYENNKQVVAIYQADWIVNPLNETQIAQLGQQEKSDQLVQIPLNKILGVHRVLDTFEVAYAFHARGLDTLLFTDMDGFNITELEITENVTLLVKDITEQDTVNITAHNPYGNYTFTIQLKYIDQDEQEREEIMWIVIVALAVIIVFGVIIVYFKQKRQIKTKKSTRSVIKAGNQQSLLTVQDQYRDQYINRTSADPNSIRGTVDLGLTDSLLEKQNTQENLQANPVQQ